jgi:hypothetical protein
VVADLTVRHLNIEKDGRRVVLVFDAGELEELMKRDTRIPDGVGDEVIVVFEPHRFHCTTSM